MVQYTKNYWGRREQLETNMVCLWSRFLWFLPVLLQERDLDLHSEGIKMTVASEQPHLLGVDDDPLSTGLVLYHLKVCLTNMWMRYTELLTMCTLHFSVTKDCKTQMLYVFSLTLSTRCAWNSASHDCCCVWCLKIGETTLGHLEASMFNDIGTHADNSSPCRSVNMYISPACSPAQWRHPAPALQDIAGGWCCHCAHHWWCLLRQPSKGPLRKPSKTLAW